MMFDNFYKNQIQEHGLVKCAVSKYSFYTADVLSTLFNISKHMVNHYRKQKTAYTATNCKDTYIQINFSHLHVLIDQNIDIDLQDYGIISCISSYRNKYKNNFTNLDTIAKNLNLRKSIIDRTIRKAEQTGLIVTQELPNRTIRNTTKFWDESRRAAFKYDIWDKLRNNGIKSLDQSNIIEERTSVFPDESLKSTTKFDMFEKMADIGNDFSELIDIEEFPMSDDIFE